MSSSFSNSETQAFTATHAKYLASKVATDLKRMQRFYGLPSDTDIASFEAELIEFLKKGYLGTVTYGFKRNNDWIEPTLRYTAKDLAGMSGTDDDPGRIRPGANVEGAYFYSFLSYSQTYWNALQADKEGFTNLLPFKRPGADEPGINGYLTSDKSYSSGGQSLDRSSVKNY